MPWNVKIDAKHKVVETTYAGFLDEADIRLAAQETLRVTTGAGCTRLLADCTTLEGGHSVFDLYELAKLFDSTEMMRGLREAVLLPATQAGRERVSFWETTGQNHGLNVRVFAERKAAMDWLLS